MKDFRAVTKKLEALTKTLSSLEKKIDRANKRIDELSSALLKSRSAGEQLPIFRAKTEQYAEQIERTLSDEGMSAIRGRHREILAMLINDGFHTYQQIAQKLGISQSRARAYIAELKNNFNVPLRQVRDPEGYKIGIDVRFVERILAFR